MLRQVLRELRFHPSRFVATAIAIAISVAFMAGSSVIVATEQNGVERQQSLPIAGADVVVELKPETQVPSLGQTLRAIDTVAVAEPSLLTTLGVRDGTVTAFMNLIGLPSEPLRSSELTAGRWPATAGETALTTGAAGTLGVGVGDDVTTLDDRRLTVVGLTGEPNSMFLQTGYVAPALFASLNVDPLVGNGTWLVKAVPGTTADELATTLRAALASQPGVSVVPAAEYRAEAVKDLADGFDVFRNLLWAFAAIAAVVGMITIANTFTILLAQRRRQIGLLRAVGAGGDQVRRRFLLEALALGILGSALGLLLGIGLAAIGATFTGSLYWGLRLPALDLVVAFLAGVLITVAAAFLPVVKGTRVRPLEALQPEPTGEDRRRAQVVRTVACALLVAAGAAVAFLGLDTAEALVLAVAGSVLISLGVLFGAPLFVPGMLAGLGRLVGGFGVTARLAAQNAARNPRRASATATALMLAVGLIVTLQVGTASIRSSALDQIDTRRPVDIAISAWGMGESLPAGLTERAARVPGVAASVLLPAGRADFARGSERYDGLSVIGFEPDVARVAAKAPTVVTDDQVLVTANSETAVDGQRVTLAGKDATVELTVVKSTLVRGGEVMVSGATLDRLGGAVPDAVLWLSIPDRSDAVSAAGALSEIANPETYEVTGGVVEAAATESILNLLLQITTALLGVAVLIALIGVSNTLGLSVLERTRESALMRALGLQARSLRVMLLIEALLLAAVGVVVGVIAGGFFGWLGAAALAGPLETDSVALTLDLPQTLGMVGIAMAAAAAASVLPGRRAAQASPTEALADI